MKSGHYSYTEVILKLPAHFRDSGLCIQQVVERRVSHYDDHLRLQSAGRANDDGIVVPAVGRRRQPAGRAAAALRPEYRPARHPEHGLRESHQRQGRHDVERHRRERRE